MLGRAVDFKITIVARHRQGDIAFEIEVILPAAADFTLDPLSRAGNGRLGITEGHDLWRIGIGFLLQRVASGFIAGWLQRHPEIRIILQNGYAPALLQQLVEGQLDLIMAPVDVIEGIPNLIVERLTGGENVIVCRAGHPLLSVAEITPENLSQARWITHARDSLLNRDTRLALTAVGVDFIDLPAFESNSASAMHAVMENSDMLTVLPDLIAGSLVESGGYAVVPFRLPGPYRPFGYVTHEDRQNPALLAFREGLSVDIRKANQRAREICERAFKGTA